MAHILNKTLKTIEQYKSKNPHYEELLQVLEEILILREEYSPKMPDDVFPVEEHHVRQKLAGGLPLVDFSKNNLDLTEPRKYFLHLLDVARKRSPEETAKIEAGLASGEFDYESMVRDSFTLKNEEEMSDDDEQFFDILGLFLEESLRPALELLVRKYHDIIKSSQWAEGYCPVCGKEPKIGELREEEGFRYLFCNQCGCEWDYMRVKCPFCGNDDQQTLAYFTIEDEEKYRVDVCNKCNRYIKTVDFRKIGEEANLDVEDIATLHLDMLANEEGYD
ncbi:MAG: formate dehydrogenase accessory protein FdhE [Deltaproteobacteria bacterium]|nr:formate dehydrogenase accessory protein FdhE [Deltaproteobacteria bacterium]MBN2688334.1 formate dehydrogenase accessory protein FdhE [Deltaproteobacteria bacterium]